MKANQYSAEQRAREKQASRDADRRALESGERSAEDLQRENGAFSFPNAVIDFANAKLS